MSERTEEKSVAVRPTRPVKSFRELFEDMDRLWEGFPSFRRMRPLIEAQQWPAVDVFEREGALVIKADTPGMSAKDIEINVNENSLIISGERSEEKEVKEKDYYLGERSYGRFTRQLPLPSGVDREKAVANFRDGVLEVTLPLREEAKQKKIEVKAS